jgi:hypothetical protein
MSLRAVTLAAIPQPPSAASTNATGMIDGVRMMRGSLLTCCVVRPEHFDLINQ